MVGVGGVVAAVGAVLVFGGMGPAGEHRDADGYYMSDPLPVDRPTYAVVSEDVGLLRGRYETLTEDSILLEFVADPDDVRVQALASGADVLFVGIAPTSAVDEYLSGVAHDEITDWSADRASIVDIEYASHEGSAPPGPPGGEVFWEASVAGTGTLTLDWVIEPGAWTFVVMNADAARGVVADLEFGATPVTNLQAFAWTSLAVGAVALIVGGSLLYLGLRRKDGDPQVRPLLDVEGSVSSHEAGLENTTSTR
jgi:hypothetical protein